jgi:hypothetical protein
MTLLLLTFPHLHVRSAHLLEHALTPRYTVLLGVSPLLAYSPSLTLLNLLNIPLLHHVLPPKFRIQQFNNSTNPKPKFRLTPIYTIYYIYPYPPTSYFF